MYDQIQALLTNTINIVAIAGILGIIAHAQYNWHLSKLPTAPKLNPDYQPSQLVTEILESQKAETEQPSDSTEPERPALIDPWQTEIISSSPRYWVQTATQVQPTLYLLPPAKEAKQSKTRKTTTKSKAPAKKQTTRKRKVA